MHMSPVNFKKCPYDTCPFCMLKVQNVNVALQVISFSIPSQSFLSLMHLFRKINFKYRPCCYVEFKA